MTAYNVNADHINAHTMEITRPAQLHRFGPFEVNLATGELRKRGFRVGLQDQPLRVLAALLERPGEIVSREELCRRLWAEGTFVDFEHSLNAAVRRLRLALGDISATPRFVETVHRRGYRFLALDRTIVTAGVERERSRLAVIPFAPGDRLSEGLTEEVVTQLARVSDGHIRVLTLTAVARALAPASMPGAIPARSAGEIGRALGAAYLIEGSVRRDGNQARVSAHLIDAGEQTHIWASSFDRVIENDLAVESELGETIARAVRDALLSMERVAAGF